jgi:hypothetical protein
MRQDRKQAFKRGKNKTLEPKEIYLSFSKPFVCLLINVVYAFFQLMKYMNY